MKRVSRSAIVERDAGDFYGLVEAIESYPEFLPWCAAAEVLERKPGRTIARLALAVAGVRQSFTTENTNVPGQSIDIRLLEGPFKSFSAAWRFTPLKAGACKVEYTMEYEFTSAVIATVLEPVFKRIANGIVEAFTQRAR